MDDAPRDTNHAVVLANLNPENSTACRSALAEPETQVELDSVLMTTGNPSIAAAQTLTWFADRLAGSAVFGAFRGDHLLGVASFYIAPDRKGAHKGMLAGMYVRPTARRAAIGRDLVDAILDYARRHVELIQLAVVSDNEDARWLYAGLGFVEYGIEKNALKDRGRYYDCVLMVKPLMASSAP